MKALLFLLALSAVSLGNLISLNTQCPEQSVPDVNKICIKPAYIEGCLTYKSTEECFACSERTISFTQSISSKTDDAV
jgi:hypothetical protein